MEGQPRLSRCTWYNHKGPEKWRQEPRVLVSEWSNVRKTLEVTADFEDGSGSWAKEYRPTPEIREGEKNLEISPPKAFSESCIKLSMFRTIR